MSSVEAEFGDSNNNNFTIPAYCDRSDDKYSEKRRDACSTGKDTKEATVCFLCREKDLPDLDCKICHNIQAYYYFANQNETAEDEVVDISFPGPGIVKRNHIYGNYVVASRTIQPGELIVLERPMTIGPYGPSDMLPLCLTCCKDIGLSSKCSKCKWPICGAECEKFYLHAENECEIFAKNGLKSKGELNEYISVETIRALLLKEKNPAAWNRILDFEPHIDARSNDYRAKVIKDFVVDFIRNKCKLDDKFSTDDIDHAVGVFSINTFWAFKDIQRYVSCLFDKITLLAHDCDPNTYWKIIILDEENNEGASDSSSGADVISKITMKVTASRKIEKGEMLAIRYIELNQPLAKRREDLRETFYFDCTCSRCLQELMDNQNQIELKIAETSLN